MEEENKIVLDSAYRDTMADIYKLMTKGEANLTPNELRQLELMCFAAEKYEDDVLKLKPEK